jgi:hypothetical protein
MNREEVIKVLTVLQTAYPAFYRGQTDQQAWNAIDLWANQFANDSYDIVSSAVSSMISTRTSGYPPNIGEIKAVIYRLTTPKQLTPQEAWSMVYRIIGMGIYHADEEWEKLPDQVKNAITPVQIREWAMDENFNEGVAASNFMKSFQISQKREQELAMIPENVKALLRSVGKAPGLEAGHGMERSALPEEGRKQIPQQEG